MINNDQRMKIERMIKSIKWRWYGQEVFLILISFVISIAGGNGPFSIKGFVCAFIVFHILFIRQSRLFFIGIPELKNERFVKKNIFIRRCFDSGGNGQYQSFKINGRRGRHFDILNQFSDFQSGKTKVIFTCKSRIIVALEKLEQ